MVEVTDEPPTTLILTAQGMELPMLAPHGLDRLGLSHSDYVNLWTGWKQGTCSLRNPSLSWTGGGEIRPQQMGALGLECYVENSSAAAGALPAEAAAVAPNSVVGPRATQLEEEEGDETSLWTWLWLLLPVPRSAAGPDAEIIADFLALGSKLVQRMVDRGADPVILSTVLQELSWDRHRRDYMEGCQDYLDCLGLPFEAGCQRSREIEPHDRDVLVAEELWDYFVGYL